MVETAADKVNVQRGINQAKTDSKQKDTDQETNYILKKQFQKNH